MVPRTHWNRLPGSWPLSKRAAVSCGAASSEHQAARRGLPRHPEWHAARHCRGELSSLWAEVSAGCQYHQAARFRSVRTWADCSAMSSSTKVAGALPLPRFAVRPIVSEQKLGWFYGLFGRLLLPPWQPGLILLRQFRHSQFRGLRDANGRRYLSCGFSNGFGSLDQSTFGRHLCRRSAFRRSFRRFLLLCHASPFYSKPSSPFWAFAPPTGPRTWPTVPQTVAIPGGE
jgi:hypothetical protein